MSYRLVTFDSVGKIVGLNPIIYSDKDLASIPHVLFNPNLFSFIGSDYLPSAGDTSKLENGIESDTYVEPVGNLVRSNPERSAATYDPRMEVILTINNPYPFVSFGTQIIQDITKATVVYNLNSSATKPVHSTTVKKFGLSSGKFTRDAGGLSGGFIYVTNIVKRSGLGAGLQAPHNRLGKGNTSTNYSSYGVELFFYPTSLSNNFTLMQKGPTGASASWKLGFDSSGGQLQFAWQGKGTTGGYNLSQNIINTAGISLNNWNHVAVSLVREGTSGITYTIKGYFNSTQRFSTTGTASSIPEDTDANGLYIGNNHLGTESFSGYIDSLRVFDTTLTGGLLNAYGFYGNTLGVPTLGGFTTSPEICFVMNFDSPDNNDAFFPHSQDYIVGIACKISNLVLGQTAQGNSASVGVRDVYRFQYGITGPTAYSDATGFTTNYGVITKPYYNYAPSGTTQSYDVLDYDYTFNLYSVEDTGITVGDLRTHYRNNTKYELMLESMSLLEGAYGNRGSSGNALKTRLGENPFRRLFSNGDSYGVSGYNTLFLDPFSDTIPYILNNGLLIEKGISRSSYTFTDALDFERTITATEMGNLRLDILEYYSKMDQARRDVDKTVSEATTKSGVKTGKVSKKTGTPSLGVDPEAPLGGGKLA